MGKHSSFVIRLLICAAALPCLAQRRVLHFPFPANDYSAYLIDICICVCIDRTRRHGSIGKHAPCDGLATNRGGETEKLGALISRRFARQHTRTCNTFCNALILEGKRRAERTVVRADLSGKYSSEPLVRAGAIVARQLHLILSCSLILDRRTLIYIALLRAG